VDLQAAVIPSCSEEKKKQAGEEKQ